MTRFDRKKVAACLLLRKRPAATERKKKKRSYLSSPHAFTFCFLSGPWEDREIKGFLWCSVISDSHRSYPMHVEGLANLWDNCTKECSQDCTAHCCNCPAIWYTWIPSVAACRSQSWHNLQPSNEMYVNQAYRDFSVSPWLYQTNHLVCINSLI